VKIFSQANYGRNVKQLQQIRRVYPSAQDVASTQRRPKRQWITRADPLASIWEDVLVPLPEVNPELLPMTLLKYLGDIISRVMSTQDAEELMACFISWVNNVRETEQRDFIAIDGKMLRRSFDCGG
jgi:hypothetical protein